MTKVQGPTQALSESMVAFDEVMRTMGEQAAVLGRAWRAVLDNRMAELEKEARRREQR